MIWEVRGEIRRLPAFIETPGCVFLWGGSAMPLVAKGSFPQEGIMS